MTSPPPLKPEIISGPQQPHDLRAVLTQIAWLMDRAIVIPGTPIRVGLDAIIGLVPGVGDFLTGLIQAGIVMVAVQHYRVPKPIAARMAANVLLDIAVGTVPFVGDLFDVGFKANTRNIRLLEQVEDHRARGEAVPTKSSILFLVAIGTTMLLALVGVAVGVVALGVWVGNKLSR